MILLIGLVTIILFDVSINHLLPPVNYNTDLLPKGGFLSSLLQDFFHIYRVFEERSRVLPIGQLKVALKRSECGSGAILDLYFIKLSYFDLSLIFFDSISILGGFILNIEVGAHFVDALWACETQFSFRKSRDAELE